MSHAGSEKVGEDEVQVALLGAGSHAGPPSEVPGLLRTLCLYSHLSTPSEFQGRRSGTPADPWDDADLLLYKATDRLGFLP